MSRKWLLFPFCLSVLLTLVPLTSASLTLRVNESATKVVFDEQATRVLLSLENPLGRLAKAQIKLELIDKDGAVRATTVSSEVIKPGASSVAVPITLRLTGKEATDTRELFWYRLRYRVAPADLTEFDPTSGIISLSKITPDMFALHVAAPEKAQEGGAYRLRVRTAHPLTSQAVAGVNIDVKIEFNGDDNDDIVLKQSTRTNANGFATLDFQIPRDVEDDDGDLKVVARRGALAESAETEVEIDRNARVMVSTDKPLYQPGQILHTRVLMFDSARHALPDQKATLEVSDPEGTTAFRTELNTSRFGVASADWAIPENTRLGDYRIEVELEDDKYDDSYGAATVKVSRYDLPNFSVNVKPDQPYYLPAQNAEVEIRADYLFGQPVKRGHVRVVRETERRWNYRDQKYETEEGDKYEGDVDAGGRFVAHINLGKEYDELKDQDYSRYRDLSYAAYFTDATTNRTEQRRFDLRLTKDAIHVYAIERNTRQTADFPLEFYIAASYADGAPASCDVTISRVWERNDSRAELALRTIRTNQYGLAKVAGLTPPKDPDDKVGEVSLMLRARDHKGASGQHTEVFNLWDKPVVRIETDKSLYRDGDSIRAHIVASRSNLVLTVDLMADEKVVQSQLTSLPDGRAALTFPYRKDFKGPMTLAAYAPGPDGERDVVGGSRTVLYPSIAT